PLMKPTSTRAPASSLKVCRVSSRRAPLELTPTERLTQRPAKAAAATRRMTTKILPFIICLPVAGACPHDAATFVMYAIPADYYRSENDGARREVHGKLSDG